MLADGRRSRGGPFDKVRVDRATSRSRGIRVSRGGGASFERLVVRRAARRARERSWRVPPPCKKVDSGPWADEGNVSVL